MSDGPVRAAGLVHAAADAQAPVRFHLRLFVAGTSPLSLRTIANLRAFCRRRLAGEVEVEVVDIYQQPALAAQDQVVAVPTLVKLLPLPVRRIIGDLSDEYRVMRAFDGQAGLASDDR